MSNHFKTKKNLTKRVLRVRLPLALTPKVPLTVVANHGVNAGGIVATVVSADLAFVYV